MPCGRPWKCTALPTRAHDTHAHTNTHTYVCVCVWVCVCVCVCVRVCVYIYIVCVFVYIYTHYIYTYNIYIYNVRITYICLEVGLGNVLQCPHLHTVCLCLEQLPLYPRQLRRLD